MCYGHHEVRVAPQDLANAAQMLVQELGAPTLAQAEIYTSPASRCHELARMLAAPKLPQPDEDLREMCFGRWEGLRWDAIPRSEIDDWARDMRAYQPGEGESVDMVAARWQRWRNRVLANGHDTTIAVTHAGLIRVALGDLQRPVPFGSIHRLHLA